MREVDEGEGRRSKENRGKMRRKEDKEKYCRGEEMKKDKTEDRENINRNSKQCPKSCVQERGTEIK